MTFRGAIVFAFVLAAEPLCGQTFGVERLLDGLGNPVGIAHAGDSRLFLLLQNGEVLIYRPETGQLASFLDIRETVARTGFEQGLIGMAFHPDHATNGFFYIHYTDVQLKNRVMRYSVMKDDPDRADLETAQILLEMDHPFDNHHGGQLQFGPDRYLYVATGDGAEPAVNAQDPQGLYGKILRIDVDREKGTQRYGIPPDNPYASSDFARQEIWASGLRNPWRFSFDRETGDMFIADVGYAQYEEINLLPAGSEGGQNYGWPIMEGFHCLDPAENCNPGHLVEPILEYDHSNGCSVTGGYRYRGQQHPGLVGMYFYGDFCSGKIWGARQDDRGHWFTERVLDTNLAISSFGEDANGELYVVDREGAIYRINEVPSGRDRGVRR